MSHIAFIGTGEMGSRMIQHLLQAGHTLSVWNRTIEKAKKLSHAQVKVCQSPAEAAENADYVISMVRDDEASKFVWLDEENGILKRLPKHAIAIESSTLSPNWVKTLAGICTQKQIAFVDAPVAGSRPQAEDAKLIYFVGASTLHFEHVYPILSAMGGCVHHAGPVGFGASIKLAVNSLFGIQLSAIAELLGFLKNLNVDPNLAMEIISTTPVCSPAVKAAANGMLAKNFSPQFPINLVEKDLNYIAEESQKNQISTPLNTAAQRTYKTAIQKKLGEQNITAISQLY